MKYIELTANWDYRDAVRSYSGSDTIPCSYTTYPTVTQLKELCESRVQHSGRRYRDHSVKDISETEFNKFHKAKQHAF